MSDVGDGAQVAAAVFTAAAAGAALRTVRQGQRLWRHGVEPDIHVQVLRNVNTGHTDLAIFNVGGGVARGVFFVLAVDDQKATGTVHDSIMAAGTKFIVQTQLPHGDDSECVVWWRNIDEELRGRSTASVRSVGFGGRRGGAGCVDE